MASPAPQAPLVNLNMVLDQVAKDKGIERSVLVDTLQNAIAQAAKKHFGQDRAIEATYNEEKQVVEVFQTLTVVERVEVEDPVKAVNQISLEEAGKKGIEAEIGDELLFQIFYRPEDEEEARVQDERYGDILRLKTYRKGFGRIAAQTAKQVIIQRTRDAERENVFNDYKDRKGEIVSGIALRFERGNIIVNLGRAEAVLPVREQTPRESYRAGDRVQAFVLDVLRERHRPQGPERAAGCAAHRLEARHQQRVPGEGDARVRFPVAHRHRVARGDRGVALCARLPQREGLRERQHGGAAADARDHGGQRGTLPGGGARADRKGRRGALAHRAGAGGAPAGRGAQAPERADAAGEAAARARHQRAQHRADGERRLQDGGGHPQRARRGEVRRADRARRQERQAGEGGSRALPAGGGAAEGGPRREEGGAGSPAADRVTRDARGPGREDQALRAATALRRVPKGATPPRVAPAGGGERRDGAGAGKAGPRLLDLPRRRMCAGSAETARDPAGAQREGGGADARPPSRVDGPRFA